MPSCCVPECQNGYYNYKRDKERAAARGVILSFFKAKQSQVEAWNRAIPRSDKSVTTADYVCSEHFYESDIVRFEDDLKMGDTILEKGKMLRQPYLKQDAVPKIFGGPSYLTKPESKRQAPRERSSTPPQKKPCKKTENLGEASTQREADSEMTKSEVFHTMRAHLLKKVHGVPKEVSTVHIDPGESLEATPGTPNQTEATSNNEQPQSPKINGQNVKLPGYGWGYHPFPTVDYFVKINQNGVVTHSVQIDDDRNMSIKIRNCSYPLKVPTPNFGIENILELVDKIRLCEGNGYMGHAKSCIGGVKKGLRCSACRVSGKNERKKVKRATLTTSQKIVRSQKFYYLKIQNKKLMKTVKSMQGELKGLHKQCQSLEHTKVEEAVKSLPQAQQQAVMACLEAAKRQGPHGNRYHVEWIYECLLMRIKSPCLYEHIRRQEVLALPSRSTLNRYMKKLKPVYGFQPALFEVLQQKIASWSDTDVHGSLIIDEMKVPAELSFDRHSCETIGMVDLGKHTPDGDKMKAGDHVFLVLFRPYRGDWVQSLGIFLSCGNVKGPVLTKIILEAVGLAEGAGLKVDSISTDAASWNRNMWTEFGVNEANCRVEHPTDEKRHLYFISDWSHLVKCARNLLCPELPQKPKGIAGNGQEKGRSRGQRKKLDENGVQMSSEAIYEKKLNLALNKQIQVPEGIVKRRHWISLLGEEENLARRQGIAALTYVPNLSRKIIFPDGFERMNVSMAYKFFSNSVRAGMEYYRKEGVEDLEDSLPTEQFVKRFNELCDTMNSHGPAGAIREDNGKIQIISEYLQYHKECIKIARKKGTAFLSRETDLGISVTLQSTLDLSKYLLEDVGFKYVMTSRFNSDPIEQFFSKLRAAGKQNSHPNPKLVAQLHRLLCVYSLVKPPKGSNVEGGENVTALMNADDSLGSLEKERKQEIEDLLDEILTNGETFEAFPVPCMLDHHYLPSPEQCQENLVSFMAGFTAFRQQKLAKGCADCLATFSKPREEAGPSFAFTRIKEIYMGYTYPSEELKNLVSAVEVAVRESLNTHDIRRDIFTTTIKYIKISQSDHVGCLEHQSDITKAMIKFYLTMRMFFAVDRKNEEMDRIRKKHEHKTLVKKSKLL